MPGLPKSIIKKYGVTKKAWQVYRGKLRRGKRKPRSRVSNPKTKRRKRNLARRKKRRGGGKSLQQQVFKWLRIGALVAPGAVVAVGPGTPKGKVNAAMELYTGVNIIESIEGYKFAFHPEKLAAGWGPYLLTVLTTYGIPKIAGIIRRL